MKLLVVEDDLSLSKALEEILKNAGHIVELVHDGATASDYITVTQYDLIILDGMLPKMDGLSVVRSMRNNKNNTPVLMLTARAEVSDKVAGLNAGADDYLTKPFATEELLARVNAMTRRTGTVIMHELSFADLTLDLDTATLSCSSESIQLSRKEFDVARMFLSNPQIILTKENFIINIWGQDSEATDNNVEAYVSFLRKKLKYLRSVVTIKAIPKIGYRLEVCDA